MSERPDENRISGCIRELHQHGVELESLRREIGKLEHTILKLMDERDARYSQRFDAQERAVEAAIGAQKELTNSAFVASNQAIEKAERYQKMYDVTHNDLLKKMDNQYAAMMPRSESLSNVREVRERLEEVKKEVALLQQSRSQSAGKEQGIQTTTGFLFALLGAVGVTAAIVGGAIQFVLSHMVR